MGCRQNQSSPHPVVALSVIIVADAVSQSSPTSWLAPAMAVLSWPTLAHVTTEPDYRQLPADLYLHEHRHTM